MYSGVIGNRIFFGPLLDLPANMLNRKKKAVCAPEVIDMFFDVSFQPYFSFKDSAKAFKKIGFPEGPS